MKVIGKSLALVLSALVVSSSAFAGSQGAAAQPRSYQQAWSAIMKDLERVVRSHTESGPYLTFTPEAYGILEPKEYKKLVQSVGAEPRDPALKNELELLKVNLLFRLGSAFVDDFERDLPPDQFNHLMWTQFDSSLKRELQHLSAVEGGKLMAHFSTQWSLKGPPFMSPLVFFAWSSQQSVLMKIHELVQMMIWDTGNAAAIREFVPRLMTNRMGGFSLKQEVDLIRQVITELHPSSTVQGWYEKYPRETYAAVESIKAEIERGSLKRSALFAADSLEITMLWTGLPVYEISEAIPVFLKRFPAPAPVAMAKGQTCSMAFGH